MGYDMRYRKADPDEAAAVSFASGIFRKACDERDELPRSERGVLDFERARREGLDWKSHEAHVGRTDRYRAAQDKVDSAMAEMRDAKKSYFRLNMSGMSWACRLMEQFGMMFTDPSERPEWPKPDAYGTSYDDVDALESPEFYPDKQWNDEELRAAVAFRQAQDEVLSWHGAEIPGIPAHKFSSNDGWIVLPAEAEAAVRIWQQAYDEMGEEAARVAVALGGSRPGVGISQSAEDADAYWSLWLRWVAYLADSVRHDGFEVH